jgi:hypothetical protein
MTASSSATFTTIQNCGPNDNRLNVILNNFPATAG